MDTIITTSPEKTENADNDNQNMDIENENNGDNIYIEKNIKEKRASFVGKIESGGDINTIVGIHNINKIESNNNIENIKIKGDIKDISSRNEINRIISYKNINTVSSKEGISEITIDNCVGKIISATTNFISSGTIEKLETSHISNIIINNDVDNLNFFNNYDNKKNNNGNELNIIIPKKNNKFGK